MSNNENIKELLTEETCERYFNNHSKFKIKNHMIETLDNDIDEETRLIIKKYHFEVVDRYIGIFFLINGKLVVYKEKLIEKNLDFIDVEKSHYDLFNTLSVSFYSEYSMYPRGRILYNNKKQCFYVYADKTILKNKELIEELKNEFNLPAFNIQYKGDEHYKMLNY